MFTNVKNPRKNWGEYFGEELDKPPQSPLDMVGLALVSVIKAIVFLIYIIKIMIRGLTMGLRGALRRGKKQPQQQPAIKPFAFDPSVQQQMGQQPYPQGAYPQQQMQQQMQQPMQQQQVPQSPMPQQQNSLPTQPASAIERIPSAPPVQGGVSLQMLNEVYGAIGYIRQALVDTQNIIGNINNAINNIYQRLNAIEGVQPIPTQKTKFVKKK